MGAPGKVAAVLVFAVVAAAGERDAISIERTLRLRHLPQEAVLDPVLENGQVVSYTRCGDSAVWTGHYLAAAAYRYGVTGDPHALDGVRIAVDGLTRLVDVTGRNLLSRCAVPADAPWAADIAAEEKGNGIYHTIVDGQDWIWAGNTSRDQYAGAFFGLGTAYDLIDDPDLRTRIAALAGRMLDSLMAASWSVLMPDGSLSTTFLIRPDQQLALLQVGRDINPGKYGSEYSRMAAILSAAVPVPLLVDAADQKSSYFKFNLDFINLFSLIRLENNSANKTAYEVGFTTIRATTAGHHNPHFNMIDRALHGPNAARDAETRADLEAWLKRPRLDFFVDWRGKVKECSADQACDPIPVEQRPPADFLWQSSPFLLYGGQKGNIESAGIDYLLPYWMARYYGVIGEDSVRVPRHTGPWR